MKIGIIGDAHLGATRYSRKRRADFSQAFVNALQLCARRQVKVICLLGDVFDSAATRRSVDSLARILTEIGPTLRTIQEQGIQLVAIPGNHEFGRGREAGELRALEELGFVRVLRGEGMQGEAITIGEVDICGLPWQEETERIPEYVDVLQRRCKAPSKILLLHNFIRGSRHIPAFIAEVDASVSDGFDRAFAGHHHVYERIGNFVIPGSTEIENMLDQSEKCIVLYDTETHRATRHRLPITHPVVILRYDISRISGQQVLDSLERDLDERGNCQGSYVYVKVHGEALQGDSLPRAAIASVLRKRDLFTYSIDLAYSTKLADVPSLAAGASIEQLLTQHFKGHRRKKAQQYLDANVKDEFWQVIRERILS